MIKIKRAEKTAKLLKKRINRNSKKDRPCKMLKMVEMTQRSKINWHSTKR
jgi:hypothetical protein